MKKILFITFSDNADHQDMAIAMYDAIKKDYDSYLIITENAKVEVEDDNHIIRVKCPLRPGLTRGTFNVGNFQKVYNWIKKGEFDDIFFESLHLWNVFIMQLHKKPKYYQMVFDVIPHEGAKSVEIMNKTIGKQADLIVLTNEKYLSTMSTMYNIPIEKIKWIPMVRRFPEYSMPRMTKKCLFFGRINPYKGANNLYEIAKRCKSISFEVFGPVSEQEKDVVNKLTSLPNVDVHPGYITGNQMGEAFRDCDWVLLPYSSATISGVVVDAYRYSRPVLAFDVGAIHEQISEGKSGYIIPANNIGAFCEKLESVINYDNDTYSLMCQNAYQYGQEQYGVICARKRLKYLFDGGVV